MESIRYIHAADLHLDTPFQGIARADSHLARLLREAAFTAMERLFRFCESEKPDFLVLAGDIYNLEDHSVKAQLALRDGCVRMQRQGVRVYLAHGNHDPLSSRLTTVAWPDNVTIFGAEPEQHVFEKNGKPIAVIHGISHARAKEGRNLAKLFTRNENFDCFQLGVLHCAVEGLAGKERSYAPCSFDDLKATGLDAWALGHVHERRVLSDAPFIVYCGNAQGLHINETGERGCYLVTVTPHSGTFTCRPSFLRLGPVQWERLELDLDDVEHLDEAERRLGELLEGKAETEGVDCAALVVRVVLKGNTALDATLRDADCLDALAERMAPLTGGTPGVWIKDFKLETQPVVPMDLTRDDLLGGVWRLSEQMKKDDDRLQDAVSSAFAATHTRLRSGFPVPDSGQRSLLLREATRLCTAHLLPEA